ncbi:MAG: membrane protein insertion efficiency factor YidD [Eubacteriales bacterium]
MKRAAIFLIKFYQSRISPDIPPSCRFYPTCSAYALEAFETRGFFVGIFLSVFRVLRCNPLFKGGYDPVPQKRKG